MRWSRGRGGGQIEDRRGRRFGRGTGTGFPVGVGGAGVGGMGIIGLLLFLFLGGGLDVGGGGGGPAGSAPPADDDAAQFVGFVVDDVQGSWAAQFERDGRRYEPTTLVLFEQGVSTACGSASSTTGPFYCPADRKVYIDLGFFEELRTRFGAPGDFAQAYVIAHEFGHHVQNLLGVNESVRRRQQADPDAANELSVQLELQADCLAGVWGATARDLLEPGDLEEGLRAAAAVGDDRIQESTTGRIEPESWTHGSAEQRSQWFRRGFDSGDPSACDTFGEGV